MDANTRKYANAHRNTHTHAYIFPCSNRNIYICVYVNVRGLCGLCGLCAGRAFFVAATLVKWSGSRCVMHHICINMHTYAHVYVCVYVCMYVCIYTYTCSCWFKTGVIHSETMLAPSACMCEDVNVGYLQVHMFQGEV
jgi:hypothetical protein